VATDSERSGSWSELEQGFFAAAPPDVPEPPPEPPRFDDLDPIGPIRPDWRVRLRREARAGWAALSAAPGALRPVVRAVARRSEPMIARARRASTRVSAQLVTMLRSQARDRRIVAAAVGALILVMGVSAGVVASRGAARATPAVDTVAARDIRGDQATQPAPMPMAAPMPMPAPLRQPPVPSDLLTRFEEGAFASMVPVEARATEARATKRPDPFIRKRPGRHRNHAKGPARHVAPAKRALPARKPAFSR
jgi:hypothetical protein